MLSLLFSDGSNSRPREMKKPWRFHVETADLIYAFDLLAWSIGVSFIGGTLNIQMYWFYKGFLSSLKECYIFTSPPWRKGGRVVWSRCFSRVVLDTCCFFCVPKQKRDIHFAIRKHWWCAQNILQDVHSICGLWKFGSPWISTPNPDRYFTRASAGYKAGTRNRRGLTIKSREN